VSRPRILIVSDVRLYREGLVEIIARSPKIEVVGSARDGKTALTSAREGRPSLVLVDMGMAQARDVVRTFSERLPDVKIVALAVSEDETHLIACAEAGVSGYVSREASLDDLVAVIEGIDKGEMVCAPWIVGMLWRRIGTLAAIKLPLPEPGPLTARELEIVDLLEEGLSNKEIASRLIIEVATVKNHVHSILEKLGVQRRAEVATIARMGRTRRALEPASARARGSISP
jgi:DNA-binding NarL/FixJ family response regulator